MNWLKWFRPGIGIKRWLLIIAVGIGLISYGLGSLLRTLYFYPAIPRPLWYATLQFVPYRNWLLMAAGAASCALGIVALFRSLMSPFALGGEQKAFIDILHEYHQLRRGPKAVVIGGGNGVEIALRGLKEYSENLTAILPPARDRAAHSDLLPAAPLEEVTSCLLALAQTEPLMARLLDYRLQDRYSFGELFLSVMADIAGSLEQGIRESGRILAVRGQVLTSSESRMAAGPEARALKSCPPCSSSPSPGRSRSPAPSKFTSATSPTSRGRAHSSQSAATSKPCASRPVTICSATSWSTTTSAPTTLRSMSAP
jgi:hypothetical protein